MSPPETIRPVDPWEVERAVRERLSRDHTFMLATDPEVRDDLILRVASIAAQEVLALSRTPAPDDPGREVGDVLTDAAEERLRKAEQAQRMADFDAAQQTAQRDAPLEHER